MQNSAMILATTASAYGVTGVSTISKAAGRNACSFRLRLRRALMNAVGASANFMNTALQSIKGSVATARLDQLVMRAVLHQTPVLDMHNAVGEPHC